MFAMHYKKIFYNRYFLLFFIVIIGLSIINVALGKDTLPLLLKQIIGVGLSSLAFYCVIAANNGDVKRLFVIYLKMAFLVALIGIIQQVSFLFDFRWGYDFSYFLPSYWKYVTSADGTMLRVNSITFEPSGFCVVMMPAFFAAIMALIPFKEKSVKMYVTYKSLIVIVAMLLSFSSIGYLGMGIATFLIAINYMRSKKYVMISLFIVFIAIATGSFVYNGIRDIKGRVNSMLSVHELLAGDKQLTDFNQSSSALFSNAYVAFKSFTSNPLFGSGLGSHELSYSKYIDDLIGSNTGLRYFLFINMADANSLFLRLISETGLIGTIAIFIFMFKFYLKRESVYNNYLWVINNAILINFIMRLVRVGHYFDSGFFFFFWIYYFSKTNQITHKNNRYNEAHI